MLQARMISFLKNKKLYSDFLYLESPREDL